MIPLKFAGDVDIRDLAIIGKTGTTDIRNLMVDISIYEDIFSPFISGKIILKESLDLINKLPLIGEEFLDLTIVTPTFENPNKIIKGRFYIYKLSDKIPLKDRESMYNLYFISLEAIKDMNLRLTNAQSGYCSDIAYRLIRGDNDGLSTNKPYNIEESSNGIKFICNYWSPIRALNYVAEKSLNKDNIASYMFFENRDGFNFISFNSLYKQEPIQNFIVDNYDRTVTFGGKSIRDIEESSNGIKFICNYWSPIRALNYVAEKSLNKDNIASYMFFENRDGFNFISFNSLYKQEPIQNFIVDNYDRTVTFGGESIRDVEEDYKRAKELSMPKGFDFIDRLTRGMFNSTLTSYDFVTKRFKRKFYDSTLDFASMPHLNTNPLSSTNVISAPYAASYNSINHTAMHNGFEDVSNSEAHLLRNASIAMAQGFRLQITVPGRTDYTIGKVVTMKTFRAEPISSSDLDTIDPIYSGRYLIASINHNINSKEHLCTMELIKDSLITGITELE